MNKVYTLETHWQERDYSTFTHQYEFFSLLNVQKAWWVSHDQPKLHIVELMDRKKLVGIVLFCSLDQGRTLQFLGDQDVSDYLDWAVSDAEKATAGLEEFLIKNKIWGKIHLVSLPQHSSLTPALKNISKKYGWSFTQEEQDVCPIISLPLTWEEYLRQVGKKQRHEIQRKRTQVRRRNE